MNNTEIAQIIVNTALEKGYIENSLPVVPELLEKEKLVFSVIAKMTREHVEQKQAQELEMQEIYSMFLFVFARACETIAGWKNGEDYTLNPAGLFSGEIPFNVNPDMHEHFSKEKLAEDLFDAFQEWTVENQGYCTERGIHPILPLLEALKWTYRISSAMTLEYLGYEVED